MKIDVCFSPALYPVYHDAESVVVVVDVFRATTTMATAFQNGVRSIRPVATIEEAIAYKEKGWLVGAERNVKRCDFADFGNSPFDYTPEMVKGKDVVFTTTNGTKAITVAKDAYRVVIGAFVNLQAVADYCLKHQRDVVVLASGWEDKVNIEDTLYGGALTEVLLNTGQYQTASDAAVIARDMWNTHKQDLNTYMEQTDHLPRLKANRLEDSVPYCLSLNLTNAVPELHIENEMLILRNYK
ncbi:2-phosphosulfolactate phosphatase [Parabacteroides sp. PF5-5]|uniref:2-phosphosulfolactate phosphatase n=1 Tax=unclassified Parabacteroides TaxID=2649774 RepID=UPI002473220F|nr:MULTISPECIES: 2-phosphosulfolactate phosphatase [unclassified Parabacteroides]MDH6306582.1 2-phosphosulfolactate phosphatase [Parabacteroides sp. PH5-39]MDH6317549.1 2-phosphosulfolactate phosphatase [Parabacteroides sp. PF5-13]MDH6321293.1 2-phosphosulfolactate phosphatase [Parabacteroides sp. PH5-13]MDH6325025.1 2-phosphosulfolactate phosphatase [Parabacteroides sp. PH5-8]MDH6328734.1 2-phosphosulfolactate phosphatase [Parabacteroides sp. PH5-41]